MNLHEAVIGMLKERYKGVETRGFKRTLIDALDGPRESITAEWLEEGWSFIPDAYLLDAEKEHVIVWEVEDSHPMVGEKVAAYAKLWFYLDCEEWDLQVLTVDRYGNDEKPVSLSDFFYAGMRAEEKERRAFVP